MTITATIRPEFIVEKQGKKFVLAAGLVDAAHRAFESLSIISEPLQMGTDANGLTWIVSTTVTCPNGTYRQWADASPQNVARAMFSCLPRLAETRSVTRALRLAVNAGTIAIFDDPDDENESPQPETRADPRPNRDWSRFWVHVRGLGATQEEVHAALGIKSVTDWPRSLEEAVAVIEKYILTRDTAKQPVVFGATFEEYFPKQPTAPPQPTPAQRPIMPTMTSKTTERHSPDRGNLEADNESLINKAIPLGVAYKTMLPTWADSYLAQENQGLRNRIRAAEEAGARTAGK